LHYNEVIFRDLKPANILIDEHGHVKLTNFGLSTAVAEIKRSSDFIGTPQYLAPEIW